MTICKKYVELFIRLLNKADMSNKYNYLFKNTIFLTIASVGTSLISFLLLPLYTAALKTSEFGIIEIIDISAMLMFYVFSLDISDVVGRFSLDDKLNKPQVLKTGINVLLKSGIIVAFIIASFCALNVFKWKRIYYLYLFIHYLLYSLGLVLAQYLRGTDKVKTITVASLVSIIVKSVLAVVFLVLLNFGIDGYFYSLILGSFALIIVYCTAINDFNPFRIKTDKALEKEMVHYSVPIAVNALGWWVAQGVDKYFVSFYNGYSLNGIYSVAFKFPSIITILCNVFNQAFGMSAVKELDSEDRNEFYYNTYKTLNAVLCISASVLIITNVFFTKVFFDEAYFTAWKYSSWLILSAVFAGFGGYFGGICDALKKNKILAISTVVSAVLNIILDFILIPRYNAYGAAISTVVSMYIIFIIRYSYVCKKLSIKTNPLGEYLVLFALLAQVICNGQSSHLYFVQGAILVFITAINFKWIKGLLLNINSIIKGRKNG